MTTRFKSPGGSEVTMLDSHARELMEHMGHSAGGRGALAAEDVPAALAKLRAAIQTQPRAVPDDDKKEVDQPVDLARRAYPLIDLLERAERAKEPVLWGV